MKLLAKCVVLGTVISVEAIGAAQAQTNVAAGIHNASEHWTVAGAPYRLKGQVYFTAGTTLTIDAGVVVASLPADQGGLAICQNAKIFVNGTQSSPVIMTSTNDVATWTGTTGSGSNQIPGNPHTGIWREATAEWNGLVVMGNAYISENAIGGNSSVPNGNNVATMEGLTNGPATDRYGGDNDDDDSGVITYLSLRYCGRVVGLDNEQNGLSLGGVGRGTVIDHIEVMNSVDDGIEVWGGTVNIKHFSIWNVGDDSFDADQGWRGKAQFGLIVQGYCLNAPQGSGVGDNCFELDGAEDSDWQPVTTATIYNCTVIGQPVDGDHGTAWRDNARVQYRNCTFMDLGEQLVKLDNVDGGGAHGYAYHGTLTWPATWTTLYNAVPPTVNGFITGTYGANYPAQTSGCLAEITDSVFFRNLLGSAYTEATARGVLPPNSTNNNVLIAGSNPVSAPIVSISRGPAVNKGGKIMLPVTLLDAHPANAAIASVASAPNDGFFTEAAYRGAFEPGPCPTWLFGWTAAQAFGFTSEPGAIDSDGDAVYDCVDGCPFDAQKITPGICGCGVSDIDTDGDAVADCLDGCPFDALKIAPGPCGCGVSAPTIITSPHAQTVVVGSFVQLTTVANGYPLNYQWRHYGVDIPGATNSTYSFFAHPATAGSYDCVVSNACSSAVTAIANVGVTILGWQVLGATLGIAGATQGTARAGVPVPCEVEWGFEPGSLLGLPGQISPGWYALKGTWSGPFTVVAASTVPVTLVSPGIDLFSSENAQYIATVPCQGGARALKIGDTHTTTGNGEGDGFGARKYFTVTDSHVYYRYALVVRDAHSSVADEPYFDLSIKRQTTDEVVYSEHVSMDGSTSGFTSLDPPHDETVFLAYLDWQCRVADLSAYIGESLYVDVVVTDCQPNPHWGYGYVDFLCANTCGIGFSITIPNVFTPNGDGINDYWGPIKMHNVFALTIDVFNVWGNNVFHAQPVPPAGSTFDPSLLLWNGTNNGNGTALPTGTYYYVVKASGCEVTQTFTGFLSIFH